MGQWGVMVSERSSSMSKLVNHSAENLTLLELVLRVQGEFRRSLEPIRVTPLQAGMILYLGRHANAKLTDAAAALCVKQPTLSEVVKDLVRNRWVTNRRSAEDRRAVCLSLTRRGEALAQNIEERVREVRSDLTPMKEASS